MLNLSLRRAYVAIVSLAGVILVGVAIGQLPTFRPLLMFTLLTILAVASQVAATALIGRDVTVDVSTAVSMAVVSFFGPLAGTLVTVLATTVVVLNTLRVDWPGRGRAFNRIFFNIGMVGAAMYLAGQVFVLSRGWLGETTAAGNILPWFLAALVNDQVNLWMLIIILHLQNRVEPISIWHQHKWAIPINVLVMSVGGGILAFAVERFDIIGIGIFFLPIVLSAYSFRLYVNQTNRQMERLEDLVAERTNDLQVANLQLEELNKTKDAYLAVLTHDMRTPLSSIKGYAQVLQKGNLPPDQQQHVAKILIRSQESLLEIVDNILEIEQLQSGTPVELDKTQFDLAFLAGLVTESLQASATEKQISLQAEADPDSQMVVGDREKIKRVLFNLVANAIKYTNEGGAVSVHTQSDGRHACVEVRDNGLGIPDDELPYIFDRFRRVKGHRHLAAGTGLGLAIVKSLVDAHGGRIAVSSQENVGSTFTLTLPLNEP